MHNSLSSFIIRDICEKRSRESTLSLNYWKLIAFEWLELGLLDSEVYQIIEQDVILAAYGCSISGLLLTFLKQQNPEKVSEIIIKIRDHIHNGTPIFGNTNSSQR